MAIAVEILRNAVEPVGAAPYYYNGVLVTGASLTVQVWRTSDGKGLDFADSTFKTSPGTATHAVTETPASSGNYYYALDTSTFVNAVAAGVLESYFYIVKDATNSRVLVDASGELRVRASDAIYRQDGLLFVRTGTAQAGGTNTITLDASASATDNLYRYADVSITSGTGAGQTNAIVSYVGSTKVASVSRNWVTQPDSTSVFAVLPRSQALLVTTGLLQAAGAATATLATTASAVDSFYNDTLIRISGGTGAGQVRQILSYVGATKVATLYEAWSTTPDATSGYEILPFGRARMQATLAGAIVSASFAANALGATWDELTASHGTAGTYGLLVRTDLDAAVSSRSTLTQSQILSDTTPFAGANINATIGSRAVPGDAMALVSNAITAAKINAAAITSAAFAVGAIDSSAFAQSAADLVWLTAARTLTAIGASGIASAASLATVQTTANTINVGITTIEGAGFTSGVDDLHAIRAAIAAIPTGAAPSAATNAAAVWNALVASFTAVGSFGALLGTYTTAPSAAAISAQVNSDITSAHGAGAYITASGFAVPGSAMTLTSGERTTVQALILDDATPFHGASIASILATVTALPSASTTAAAVVTQAIAGAPGGSVGAALATASGYVVPSVASIVAGVWGANLSGYGTYAQIALAGGVLYATKIIGWNRAVEATGAPGTITLYRDDGVTVYAVASLRDVTGQPIAPAAGEPAQRTAAV